MEKKYNMRSPAVKRLMREAIELKDATPMYSAQPLEDNLFEWHFTIMGPQGTEFEGGYYHGRIILPTEYPMKPPSIIMLTPNGRFELHQKICLSASAYHPELWQPSWSIRTVLLAIIGFMPTEGVGAIGSMDCSPEDRKRMARRSLDWVCPVCGIANRDLLPKFEESSNQEEAMAEAADIVTKMAFKSEAEVKTQKLKLQSESLQQKKSQPSESEKGEDKKGDIPQRTKTEAGQSAESIDSATNLTNTQSQGDTIGGGSPRHRRLEAGATSPTVTPPVSAQTVQNSSDRGKGVWSLVLISLLLIVILALAVRRLFMM